jgi:hypothetical protein
MKPWTIRRTSIGEQRLDDMQTLTQLYRSERDRMEFRKLYREHMRRLRDRYEEENKCAAPTVDDEVLKWSIDKPYKKDKA